MAKSIRDVFTGVHRHRLDDKNRVCLPVGFRDTIRKQEDGGENYGIAIAPDETHLVVLPLKALFQQAAKMGGDTQAHRVAPFCAPFRFDKQGRMQISKDHVTQLGVAPQAKLVFVGTFDRIEVWPEDRWDKTERQKRLDRARPVFGEVAPEV